MLKGKKIVLGVSGGIAVYKACDLCSKLVSRGAEVKVIMTKNATEFVSPLTFEVLSKNPVTSNMWDRNRQWEVEHISLAEWADIFVLAPATANLIAKVAQGVCDDMLTTTLCATKAKVMVCPAMNVNMYNNPVVQENMKKLLGMGYLFVDSEEGRLACGTVGKGRLAGTDVILSEIENVLFDKKDYIGKKVLITAGATRELIDGVRSITNRSSGKMGMEIARRAFLRGASVTVVGGIFTANVPRGVNLVKVDSTQEMYDAVMERVCEADYIIKSAAPADYRVENKSENKIKDKEISLHFVKNPDIAKSVGEIKGDKKLVVFSAETENLLENAKQKLFAKNADLVVANDVTKQGAGFETDTNDVVIMDRFGNEYPSGLVSKAEVADMILDKLITL
ncbi:MAG: bifunctional phosphopantothenoylcysteine decarboxylase/phosphopantothenate--cysteine ligase CoaBC [Clostridia bacterium]|nr:bifunctional phosphopantothenoylcysteine decarboxylase/phosphopantothenate--cysteine ligase CoaBC [Clostridia bacterium]